MILCAAWRFAKVHRRWMFAAARRIGQLPLAKAVGASGEVTGLDFSESMLEAGKDKVKPFPTISLIHGNAMELPFPDETFDYVTIGFGLRNVPDYETGTK